MVAVLALTHKRGGRCSLLMASPRSSVVRIRDSRISRRLFRLYQQFTLRPARLITTSASSNSLSQSSESAPCHETICQGATAPLRDRTVTALPRACRCPATIRPRLPRAPGNYHPKGAPRRRHVRHLGLASICSCVCHFSIDRIYCMYRRAVKPLPSIPPPCPL